MTASWLPPELTIVQPYSMGPVTHWAPLYPRGATMPAMGTIAQMDDRITAHGLMNGADMSILGCLVAPKAIQKAAQASGETAIIMERPRGLLEALAPVPHAGVGANSVIGRKAQRVVSAGRREIEQQMIEDLGELLADDGED